MRGKRIFLFLAVILSVQILVTGCIQMPTEKRGVSDLRPSISFRAEAPNMHDARVVVDGLDMGRLGSFLEGESVLRILPGSHLLRVISGSDVLVDEKIYVGDGVTRVFVVK